jgi:23S rRNA (cytidine2498-2'-O)-methyltransferase
VQDRATSCPEVMRPRHAQDKRRKARHEERAETQGKRDERAPARGKRVERGATKGKRVERPGKGKRDERGATQGKRVERGATQGKRVERGASKGRDERLGKGKRDERPGKGKRDERATEGKRDDRLGKGKRARPLAAPRRPDGTAPPERSAPADRPLVLGKPRGGIQTGDWLLTTREGSEQDVIDELALGGVVAPPAHFLAPALVVATRWPKREKQLIPLTFARQALPVQLSVRHDDWDVMVARLGRMLTEKLAGVAHYALHVWVPDSAAANPLASSAEQLEARLAELLASQLPDAKRMDDAALRRLGSMPFAQVCLAEHGHAIAGVMYSNQALSLARGGRTRVRVTGELPSRAARKVEEGLAWLGVAPGPGEVCVDLGAAPGGWTFVLSEKRARVIAVDPAKLRPEIAARKNVEHVPQNAFHYEPKERVDWLFCDMAYRPLEVAALLARWGRRGWARMLVANVKLPMKKKAEILARVRHILEHEGEWKHVKTRQLYHDRDEITLTALRA